MRGGIRRDTAVLYNLDLTAEIDTGHYGLNGGTLFVYGMVNNAQELNPIVGDAQVSSNIDNGALIRLEEFWYEQAFPGGAGSLRVGLYDLNSEFDAIDPAGLFLSSSHGIGPDYSQSGENGPSIFPSTSLTARFQYQLSDRFTVRAAILDAVPNDPDRPRAHKISLTEGALLAAEVDVALREDWRLALGIWHYTSSFEPILPGPADRIGGNTGVYALTEFSLSDATRGWLRIGRANSHINPLSHYIGGGIVHTGLLSSRPDDSLGFAIAAAGNGRDFRDAAEALSDPVDKYEVSFELTYRFQVTPWLTLQPDLQYIRNPGMAPALKDALVASLRVEIGWASE